MDTTSSNHKATGANPKASSSAASASEGMGFAIVNHQSGMPTVNRFTASDARTISKGTSGSASGNMNQLFATKVGLLIRDTVVKQFYSKVRSNVAAKSNTEKQNATAKICIDIKYFIAAALLPENETRFGVNFSDTEIPAILNGKNKEPLTQFFKELETPALFIQPVTKALEADGYTNVKVAITADGEYVNNVEVSGSWSEA